MENMGRINSLFDRLMLRDDVLADAAKYLDLLGLLKPIRDFMSCSDLQGQLDSMIQERLELERPERAEARKRGDQRRALKNT